MAGRRERARQPYLTERTGDGAGQAATDDSIIVISEITCEHVAKKAVKSQSGLNLTSRAVPAGDVTKKITENPNLSQQVKMLPRTSYSYISIHLYTTCKSTYRHTHMEDSPFLHRLT